MSLDPVAYQLTPSDMHYPPKTLRQLISEVARSSAIDHLVWAIQDAKGASVEGMIEEILVAFIATTELAPALDGEPVFVLRAQDKTAPLSIFMWAEEARQRGAAAKADGALTIANEMIAWQLDNPTRVKNPD